MRLTTAYAVTSFSWGKSIKSPSLLSGEPRELQNTVVQLKRSFMSAEQTTNLHCSPRFGFVALLEASEFKPTWLEEESRSHLRFFSRYHRSTKSMYVEAEAIIEKGMTFLRKSVLNYEYNTKSHAKSLSSFVLDLISCGKVGKRNYSHLNLRPRNECFRPINTL